MAAATDSSQVKSATFVNRMTDGIKSYFRQMLGYIFPYKGSYTIATTNVDDINDVLKLCTFPNGYYLHDLNIEMTDVDTNVAPAHVFDILLLTAAGATQETIISGSTIGQGAGFDAADPSGKGVYAGGLTLAMKTTTAAATPAAGTLTVHFLFSRGILNDVTFPVTRKSV